MNTLTQLLPQFAIAVLTALITVYLALHRFRTEKWWERKAETYSHIIEALHSAKHTLEVNYKAEMNRHDIPAERDKTLNERSLQANDDIRKSIDTSAFLLCDAAHQRLVRYSKEADAVDTECSYFEYLDNLIPIHASCIADIIKIARKDLGIRYK